MDKTYDVVVIGGGAAGLSGALALGRARRSVLVVDDRSPRNAPAHGVHNYLGREGTPPDELLHIGRREVAAYGVEFLYDSATSAERLPDGMFSVLLSDRRVLARRVLVATGVTDDLPDLPGVKEGWGETVIHCPYCHGWEVRDQRLGVLATGPMSIHQALLFRQWSDDIVLFAHEWAAPSDDEAEQLAARGIAIITGAAIEWQGNAVRMASGELVPRDALVVGAPFRARSLVLSSLGVEEATVEMNGHVIGTHIPSDQTGLTTVPGVWVAGNLTSPTAQVIASAAGGLMAGAMINADLVNEETRIAVEYHRRAAPR
jgi:thioredoxin reductase